MITPRRSLDNVASLQVDVLGPLQTAICGTGTLLGPGELLGELGRETDRWRRAAGRCAYPGDPKRTA